MSCGSPLHEALKQDIFRHFACGVIELYGLTEGIITTLDPEEIASQFCGHPDADPVTCCDPDNHEGDPNCEDLKGLYGNMTGTKRYAYLAKTIDNDGDGRSDYQYYVDRGGTLDLCDTSGANTYMDALPDFVALTEAYGHVGMRIDKPADVEGALKEAFAMKDRLVFLDFITDQGENVYPMIPAGAGLNEMILV